MYHYVEIQKTHINNRTLKKWMVIIAKVDGLDSYHVGTFLIDSCVSASNKRAQHNTR